MFGISEATAAVCETIANIWPHRFGGTELRDELSLGDDGLGLDSVEIVELLMACEKRFGREAGEELLATAPLTIERVARYFARD